MKHSFNSVIAATCMSVAITGQAAVLDSAIEDSIAATHQLKEVVVNGTGAERNVKAAEMGHHTIDEKMILNLPVMFGEPDIVKTIHTLPGVSQGMEGFTGLYVRGGDNDQNLFLYQGLPLYHVSHLGGVFSSFNAFTVNKLDFYKAAFPARYGGRVSSISDISMKQPDFDRYHGRFTLGLLSLNAYVSGPIRKEKTAFSAAVRRSWIDIFSAPTLAIMNAIKKKDGIKHIAGYDFMDFNARIDHKFNPSMQAYIMGYYGHDNFKIGQRKFSAEESKYFPVTILPGEEPGASSHGDSYQEDTNRLSWGNWGVLGSFIYRPYRGALTASVYYSSYSSTYRQENEYELDSNSTDTHGYKKSRTKNNISDVGLKLNYTADFSRFYTLSAGAEYIFHSYLPEDLSNRFLQEGVYREDINDASRVGAGEGSLYADNIFNFGKWVALSLGVRGSLFTVRDHTYGSIEPRASLRVRINDKFSVKAGYADMTQYVQQVSTNYINLPTDLWLPTVPGFEPLRSRQSSIGVYGTLPWNMYFSVEGWYKDMKNLLEYKEGVTILNPNISWEQKLTSGKGWAYGADFSLTKEVGPVTGSIGYGLMWNWRKFADLNQGEKFPAKFDNRHKINVNVSWKLNKIKKPQFNPLYRGSWLYLRCN